MLLRVKVIDVNRLNRESLALFHGELFNGNFSLREQWR